MTFIIQDNQLTLQNSATVDFKYPIKHAHEVSGMIIVILHVPPGEQMPENVFGITADGKHIWQIEPVPSSASPREDRYVGLIPKTDQLVTICNWDGTAATVDVKTGKIVDTYITK